MCTVEYDNYCSVWREEFRKARKEHYCDTCGATIHPGDRYLSLFAISDGERCVEKQCEACQVIAERFAREHNVEAPFPSSLLPFLDNCVDHGDEDSQRWRVACDEIRERNRVARAS